MENVGRRGQKERREKSESIRKSASAAHRVGSVVRISDHRDSSRGVFDSRRRQSSAIGSRTGGLIVFSTDSGTRLRSDGPSRCCIGIGRVSAAGSSGVPWYEVVEEGGGGLGEVGRGEEPNSDDAEEEDWLVKGEASRYASMLAASVKVGSRAGCTAAG